MMDEQAITRLMFAFPGSTIERCDDRLRGCTYCGMPYPPKGSTTTDWLGWNDAHALVCDRGRTRP